MAEPKITFQGYPGSYSDLACRDRYPDHQPVACEGFEEAFSAVAEGNAELAMIPIENSVAGRVADIHHLLPESRLQIVGEAFQRVRHQLLGLPGARLGGLRTVHSHPHALAQCRQFIRDRRLRPVAEADTAGAAVLIAGSGDSSKGAIASALAAGLHGLTVLAPDIADVSHNVTRFLVMAREPVTVPRDVDAITTFVFQVRNLPGALYKALGGFATGGVNMQKLESYMLDGSFTSTQFYCDVAGHPEHSAVAKALEELRFFSRSVRILGVYPADPIRDRH
jgi:prephenate dehydratase